MRIPSNFAWNIAQEEKARREGERKKARAARSTGAHTTMPIKDPRMVQKWLAIAREHDGRRVRGGVSWYMLLLLGFNTGLRIGDICTLRVGDVRGRERVRVIAEKTDKMTDIKLQEPVRRAIDAALKNSSPEDFALLSRQKNRKNGASRPISRQRCYAIVKEIAERAGFTEHVGCHTLRKTFAWNFYQADGDLAKLQKVLNHSSQEATIHYLGLDQLAVDQAIDKMITMA